MNLDRKCLSLEVLPPVSLIFSPRHYNKWQQFSHLCKSFIWTIFHSNGRKYFLLVAFFFYLLSAPLSIYPSIVLSVFDYLSIDTFSTSTYLHINFDTYKRYIVTFLHGSSLPAREEIAGIAGWCRCRVASPYAT